MRPQRSQGVGRALLPGSRVGDHTILRRLARGGMAEVYLAHEHATGGIERFVALKVILPHMAGEPSFISMFLREARVAATLQHPNIAQVLAAGEEDGEPFLVMEYVHGETVHALLRAASGKGERLPLGPAVNIMLGACEGLNYAHERRDLNGRPLHLVHRDVSPSNLMVRFDGTIKLLDFGIAKAASQTTATATGVFKGKSGYMSPEQCADEPLDRRSDVFNLGILLYELTTGRRAFFGDNPLALINKIANGRYTRPRELDPDYPLALAAIVEHALAVEAEERIPSAAALAQELEAFAQDRGLLVSPSETAAMMARQFGKRPYPSLAELPAPTFASAEPEVTEDSETVALAPSDVAVLPTRRPRMVGVLAAAGIAATIGAAAWSMAGTPDPPTSAPADVGAPPPASPQPTPAAPAPPPIVAEAEAVEAVEAPQAQETKPEPEPEPGPKPEPPAAAAKTKPAKKRRKPKKKRTKKHPDDRETPEGFYP